MSEKKLYEKWIELYKKEIEEFLYDVIPKETKCTNKILLGHGGDEKHIPLQQYHLFHENFLTILLFDST